MVDPSLAHSGALVNSRRGLWPVGREEGHAHPHPWVQGIADSLWLLAIGAACLVVAYVLRAGRGAYEGGRLPLWELFLALGIIALVGGFIAAGVREEAPEAEATSRGARIRAKARRTPIVEEEEPPAPPPPVVRRAPALAFADPDLEAAGEDWGAPPAEAWGEGRSAPAPEEPLDLGELDRLDEDLRRVPASAPSSGWMDDDLTEESPRVGSRRPAARRRIAECGACGISISDPEPFHCRDCGSPICESCRRGLEPPPCPSCATVLSARRPAASD